VVEVAWHRAAAVIVGVFWAALLSRFWWPAQARQELSKALGELSSHFVFVSQQIHLFVRQVLFRVQIDIQKR